jgi:PAS domain S-box-containing protein
MPDEEDPAALARRFEALLSTINYTVVWEVDPATGAFTYVSPRAERVTGVPAERWLALGPEFWREHLPDEDLRRLEEALRLAPLHAGDGARLEHRLRRPDGHVIWVHTGVVLGRRGDTGAPALHGATTDVTPLKTAEESARQAVRARDELVGLVTHDLRNLVHSALLGADLIVKSGEAGPAVTRWAEGILRAGHHMLRLLADLLDPAALTSATLAIEPRPQGITTIVEDAVEAARDLAAAKGVDLEVAALDPSAVVRCDRRRILQVFQNLLGNAIKFTPPGGAVVVAARPGATEVEFSVEDTGPGLSADDLSRLWERGWKKDPADPRGAGLGLFIARSLVEAHGGQVRAESRPGGGATFSFTLPRAEPPAGGPPG